jgi:hypothetical protein
MILCVLAIFALQLCPAAAQAPPFPLPPGPAEREEYAVQLQRAVLEAGGSLDVMVYDHPAVGNPPTLLFFGHFSKAFVFQAVRTGQLLRSAKNLQFKSVAFFDRGPDGLYVFDLTGSEVPRCARFDRVCW